MPRTRTPRVGKQPGITNPPSHRPDGSFAPGNTLGFKKGRVANPYGRPPKGRTLSDCLRRLGAEEAPEQVRDRVARHFPGWPVTDMTLFDCVCAEVLHLAATGTQWAVELVFDRIEGRAPIALDVTAASRYHREDLERLGADMDEETARKIYVQALKDAELPYRDGRSITHNTRRNET